MAGLKKARRAAEKAAAQAKAKRQPPGQTYQNRALTPPQQAEKVQPANPWLMTTADMPSEKDLP